MAFDLTCLATLKAKSRSASSALGRLALADDLQIGGRDHAVVARLHEQAAGERAHHDAGRARIGQRAHGQQAQVLLGGEDRLRLVGRIRRDHHLGEDLGDLLGCRGVDGAAQGDDAAEGADRIAAQRLEIRVLERRAGRDAARIGVLDDGDRRACCGRARRPAPRAASVSLRLL